jgi:hypothetical protein
MSSTAVDSSEDVNDFLQRIKELGDRRDQEDEERNRKLEEEILQGRKERQARRAGKSIRSHFTSELLLWSRRAAEYLADHQFRTRQVNFSHKVLSCKYSNIFSGTCSTTEQLVSGFDTGIRSARKLRA